MSKALVLKRPREINLEDDYIEGHLREELASKKGRMDQCLDLMAEEASLTTPPTSQ